MRKQHTSTLVLAVLAAVSFQAIAEERICTGTIGPRQLEVIRVPDTATCT